MSSDTETDDETEQLPLFYRLLTDNLNNRNNDFLYDYFILNVQNYTNEQRLYFSSLNSFYYNIILYNKKNLTYQKLCVNFDEIDKIEPLFIDNIYPSLCIKYEGTEFYAYDVSNVLCDLCDFEKNEQTEIIIFKNNEYNPSF